MIDPNKNLTDHILARMLAKIGLQEAVHRVAYLPFNKDLGNHRPIMIDVTIVLILGQNLPKIVPP